MQETPPASAAAEGAGGEERQPMTRSAASLASVMCHPYSGPLREATMVELAERKTPLLRWRGALLKLECLRPAGGFDDRAVAIFPTLAPGTEAALAATGPGALAAAAWARRRRVRLRIALPGRVTHEMRETLRLWGVTFDHFTAREEALRRAREMAPEVLPPLDGPKASAELARTLGAEL